MQQISYTKSDHSKWYVGFLLLSMERAEAFLPRLGLNLTDFTGVRTCARRFIETYYDRTRTDTIVMDPKEDFHLWFQSLVRRALTCIDESAGSGIARQIQDWVQNRFHYDDRYDQMAKYWEGLFKRLVGHSPIEVTALPLVEDKVEKLKRVIREYLVEQARLESDRIDETDAQPLTGWDEYVYKSYQGDVPAYISPIGEVYHLIHQRLTANVWKATRGILTPEEIHVLLVWARSQTNSSEGLAELEE